MERRDALLVCVEQAIKLAENRPYVFIENFVQIEDKDSDPINIPFKLWESQKPVLQALKTQRRNVILKARQLGITWLVLAYAVSCMIARHSFSVVALSQTEREAGELVRRVKFILANMPELFFETSPFSYEPKVMSVNIYYNGLVSTFVAMPSARGAARSFTANLVILDEWAFQQYANEIFASAYPTINRPLGGQIIGLSTMARGTLFEDVFTNADLKGFNQIFVPWYADPRRTPEWYTETKAVLGDAMYSEYPATVEEALMIVGGAFFSELRADVHLQEPVEEREGYRYYQTIDYGLDMTSIRWIWVSPEGDMRVYREYDCPNLTISDACIEIRRYWSKEGQPFLVLAPPDLWNREQTLGKSREIFFAENGVTLTKTSNDFEAGCAALKELFKVVNDRADLTIDKDVCPVTYSHLTKIQKDKNRPNVYAKQPHDLTHCVDSLRCFAIYWIDTPLPKKGNEKTPLQKYREKMLRRRRK